MVTFKVGRSDDGVHVQIRSGEFSIFDKELGATSTMEVLLELRAGDAASGTTYLPFKILE
jgi:hypothetical protein